MTTHTREHWLTRERILVVVLIAVSALVGWLAWRLVEPFVPALTWALVLAVVAHPLHERILRYLRAPGFAAGLAVVLVTLVIALPTALLAREIGREAVASVDAFHRLIDGERWSRALDRIEWLAPLRPSLDSGVTDLKGQAAQASGTVAKGVQGVLASGVEAVVTVIITFFLLFFFLRDKWRILAVVEGLMPLAPAESAELVHKLRDMISAVVYGTLVVALVQGALGGMIFWWLGLPSPLLWGSAMALLAVLPLFGASIIWAPAAALLALEGDWDKAMILVAWGGLVIGLIDNILLPMLLRNKLHMHTIPVFIAAVGGLFAYGATGIVLGPLILALVFVLLEVWKRRMALHQIVEGVNDTSHWEPPKTGTTPKS